MNNTAYTFDIDTRELIDSYERDPGTLTTLGDDRTLDIPPPPLDWHAIVRNLDNTEWNYVIDLRSQDQYSTTDGSVSKIDYTGNIKDGFTLRPRPDTYYIFDGSDWVIDPVLEAEFLAQLKITKKNEFTTLRDGRIDGFDVITIEKGSFNIDRVGLNKLSNRLVAKQHASGPDVITSYVTTDLVSVDLTKDDVIEILDHQDDIETQIGNYYVDLIDQVNKAQTIEAVTAITWSDQAKQKV